MTEKAPRPTPLRTVHEKAGGRLVDFAGWELPIQFEGIQAEHRLVREHVGLFDVSHMGRVAVRGTDAGRFLNGLLPYDMSRLTPGRMAYTVLCNHDGGAIDAVAGVEASAVVYGSRDEPVSEEDRAAAVEGVRRIGAAIERLRQQLWPGKARGRCDAEVD